LFKAKLVEEPIAESEDRGVNFPIEEPTTINDNHRLHFVNHDESSWREGDESKDTVTAGTHKVDVRMSIAIVAAHVERVEIDVDEVHLVYSFMI
jgi:hypothetical protein